jgi:hypothetical protein
MPGLDGTLVTCRSVAEYQAALSRLILDCSYRIGLGEALRDQIARHHFAEPWLRSLEAIYARSRDTAREGDLVAGKAVAAWTGEPDVCIQAVHGGDPDAKRDTDRLLKFELGVLPTATRLREWWRLFRSGLLHGGQVRTGNISPAGMARVPALAPEATPILVMIGDEARMPLGAQRYLVPAPAFAPFKCRLSAPRSPPLRPGEPDHMSCPALVHGVRSRSRVAATRLVGFRVSTEGRFCKVSHP